MICIERLAKKYGGRTVLKGISLKVEPGELFAFLGPNGAGKTTTIRILTGLTRPTTGRVRLNGYDIAKQTVAAKKEFGLVSQYINLDNELTLYENLLIHCRLHHMPRNSVGPRIDSLLNHVGLEDKHDTLAGELSGGMKRRVMIARALLHSPGILFLDEPTVGLDPDIRRRIWELIKKIQLNGVTVFLTTHYMEEAEMLAGRVAFIDRGKIVIHDTPHNLMKTVGEWAVEEMEDERMRTRYFDSRHEAEKYAAGRRNEFAVRRVNLEDAFLKMTGKKVQ